MAEHDDDKHRRPGREASTADKLRKEIDRGKAGDKSDFPDPAAAPLGTDAEAGGSPPTREELERARKEEVERRPDEGEASRKRPNSAADPD